MDFRDRDLSPRTLRLAQQLILERKLAYQPFVFTDQLEVGEGLKFRDGESAEGAGSLRWDGAPGELDDIQTRRLDDFRQANAQLRVVYEHFVSSLLEAMGGAAGRSFAEFGCSTGYFVHALALQGAADAYGFDFTNHTRSFELFREILGLDPARHHFRYAEWDSLRHDVRYSPFPKVDATISIAVTCHVSDPLHHLAFLASRAKQAMLLFIPVNEDDGLTLRMAPPQKYPDHIEAFPLDFDNDVQMSRGLVHHTLGKLGFGELRTVEAPEGLDERMRAWFSRHETLVALRTGHPPTAFNGAMTRREPANDAPLRALVRDLPRGLKAWKKLARALPVVGPALEWVRPRRVG